MNPVNYTFLVLAVTIVFFIWGKIRSDLVAFISMLTLFFGGVLDTSEVSGLSPYPLLIIVSISASTAFLTPIGTTTNLMVMTPGGYSFNDYVMVGLPLMMLVLVVSLLLVPLIWPF